MFHLGVVENNLDPKKLGRLQVRIFGLHTENRTDPNIQDQYLPVEHLPWAMPAFPISNSNINGIGDFSTIERGTRVWCFFADQHKQKPVYFAVCPFILDALPDFSKGFSDPTQSLPTADFKDESSISRLARNEKIDDTIVKEKNDNKTTWTQNEVSIEEPESAYNAQYPFNRVIETGGGIVIELDSTPDNKRVHIYHPSGTYEEINNDGQRVKKTTSNDFEIILEDKYLYVKGNLSIKVDGNTSIEVDGNSSIVTKGNSVVVTEGTSSVEAAVIELSGTTSLTIAGEGVLNLGSTGIVNITGSFINLN